MKTGRKRANAKGQVAAHPEPISHQLEHPAYWVEQAKAILPHEDDKWIIGEMASILQQVSKRIGGHFRNFSKLLTTTEKKTLSFSLGVEVCRLDTPSEVSTTIGYGPRYKENMTVRSLDPEQEALPMEVTKASRKKDEEQEELPGTEGETE